MAMQGNPAHKNKRELMLQAKQELQIVENLIKTFLTHYIIEVPVGFLFLNAFQYPTEILV